MGGWEYLLKIGLSNKVDVHHSRMRRKFIKSIDLMTFYPSEQLASQDGIVKKCQSGVKYCIISLSLA